MKTTPSSASKRLVAIALLLLGLTAAEARAGTLDVNAGAAFSGNFGLEVTPGSLCLLPERVTLDSEIVIGDVTACSYLVATNTFIDASVDLTVGIAAQFGEGFTVGSGNEFGVHIDSSLTRLAFLTDRSPAGETSYQASFRLRLDDLAINLNDQFVHFAGYSDDGVRHFEVLLKRVLLPLPGEDRLRLAAREDDGTRVETPAGQEVMLPAGYNLIEIDWLAGGGTGSLAVSLNGVPFGSLMGLDNDQARIDYVEWGVVDEDVDGTTGSLDVDDFESTQ